MIKHHNDKLFQVRLSNYHTFYVFANGYDEAARKTKAYMDAGWSAKQIISDNGSLPIDGEYEIKSIEILTDEIIF